MSITETQPWDVVAYLDTESARMADLEAAMEDGDPGFIAALSNIARARSRISRADVDAIVIPLREERNAR